MAGKIKTIVAVVLLTGLIWVYAERQVTQTTELEIMVTLPSSDYKLPIAKNDYLLEYLNARNEPAEILTRRVLVQLQGPSGKIQSINNLKNQQIQITLPEIPQGPLEGSSDYTVNVVKEVLGGILSVGNMRFNVIGASPELLAVRITKLGRQKLPIKVCDSLNNELAVEAAKPAALDGVPVLGPGQGLEATVTLSDEQRLKASQTSVVASAKWAIGNRTAEFPVEVKLAAQSQAPIYDNITPQFEISMPEDMLGKYQVKFDPASLEAAKKPIRVRVFPGQGSWLIDYQKNCPLHLLLYIRKNDTSQTMRELIYFVPPAFQKHLEIAEPPRSLWFTVVPIDQPVAATK